MVKLNAASIQRKFPEIGLELLVFNKNITITKDGCFFSVLASDCACIKESNCT